MDPLNLIEKNNTEMHLLYKKVAGAEVYHDRDCLSLLTGKNHPLFNGVLHADLSAQQGIGQRDRISEIMTPFRNAGLPFMWWIWDSCANLETGKIFRAEGMNNIYNSLGLLLKLSSMSVRSFILPEKTELMAVTDMDDLRIWSSLWSKGFGFGSAVGNERFQIWNEIGTDDKLPWVHLLLYVDSVPVGTIFLFWGSNEVAGLYGLTIKKSHRNKNLGSILVFEALKLATKNGAKWVVAYVDKMSPSWRIANRLGSIQQCTIQHWILGEMFSQEATPLCGNNSESFPPPEIGPRKM